MIVWWRTLFGNRLHAMEFLRKLFLVIRNSIAARRKQDSKRNLLGMYFGESNSSGRRKSNRDRA